MPGPRKIPDQPLISLEGKDKEGNETLDDIYRLIGSVGRVQRRALLFGMFLAATVGCQNVCPVFTLKTPSHRCRIPNLDNDTYTPKDWHHEAEIQKFIPLDADGNYDMCTVWKYDDDDDDNNATSRRKHACSSWVYDDSVFTRTIATDLDLVCEHKILRSTSSMLIFAGKFFGAIFQGFVSDRFGRRFCVRIFAVLMFAATVANVTVNSVGLLFAFRFLTGFATTGSYLLCFVLIVELMEPSRRTLVGTVMQLSLGFGHLSLAPIAYFLRDWRYFQAALLWSSSGCIVALWFLIESPRWLLSRKRVEDAHEVLKVMARINKVDLPQSKLTNIQSPADNKRKESSLNLFRVPRLAVRWVVLYTNWCLLVMVYYGLMLNVSNMKGNIFLNYTLLASLDVISITVGTFIVGKVNRKPFYISVVMGSGIILASGVIPITLQGPEWIVVALSMVGKFATSIGMFLVYIYSAELWPTSQRGVGMGSCSMSGRLGGIASPYVADISLFVAGPLGQALPLLVCGVAGVLGALIALVLPETRGKPLPETIEDAAKIKRRSRSQVADPVA